PLWEGAAVDEEEEQQHQDEAKVGDAPGGPDQHLLQDTGQAVEVEPADRGVELLLGDAELAEPAGVLVEESVSGGGWRGSSVASRTAASTSAAAIASRAA